MRFNERIAEMPITEWSGVRVRVTIEHPGAPNTLTYQQILDSRLTPIHPLRRPLDTASDFEVREYFMALDERKHFTEMIAQQIASAITHAIMDGEK